MHYVPELLKQKVPPHNFLNSLTLMMTITFRQSLFPYYPVMG